MNIDFLVAADPDKGSSLLLDLCVHSPSGDLFKQIVVQLAGDRSSIARLARSCKTFNRYIFEGTDSAMKSQPILQRMVEDAKSLEKADPFRAKRLYERIAQAVNGRTDRVSFMETANKGVEAMETSIVMTALKLARQKKAKQFLPHEINSMRESLWGDPQKGNTVDALVVVESLSGAKDDPVGAQIVSLLSDRYSIK